ncbi:MAG: N-formylglutamate amidohydrolase [Roseobacter sp.]
MPVEIVSGSTPVIVVLPYTGTNIQRVVQKRLAEPEHAITAPDHYLDRLFDDLGTEINVLRCNFHRYVSDVNREGVTSGGGAYSGMVSSVPLVDTVGRAIWSEPPQKTEAANWRSSHYAPFHAAIGAKIAKIRAKHGHAILITCWSLKSGGPFKDQVIQADLNLSTHMGGSCDINLAMKLAAIGKAWTDHSCVLNGIKKAGWITRNYGRPQIGTHAIDLVLNDACFVSHDAGEGHYDTERATELRSVLSDIIAFAANWKPN